MARLLSHCLALVALAMLSLASVKSAVMRCDQAPGPSARMAMADMPGMAMPAAASPDRHAHKTPCPWCEAASHLPVATAIPASPRIADVSFVTFVAVAEHGPRGPPALELRARGPPSPSPNA